MNFIQLILFFLYLTKWIFRSLRSQNIINFATIIINVNKKNLLFNPFCSEREFDSYLFTCTIFVIISYVRIATIDIHRKGERNRFSLMVAGWWVYGEHVLCNTPLFQIHTKYSRRQLWKAIITVEKAVFDKIQPYPIIRRTVVFVKLAMKYSTYNENSLCYTTIKYFYDDLPVSHSKLKNQIF